MMKETHLRKGTIAYFGGFEMPDKNAAAHRVLQNAKIFYGLGFDVVFAGVDKTIKADSFHFIKLDVFQSCPSKYPNSFFSWIKYLISFKHSKYVLNSLKDLKYVVVYNAHAKQLRDILSYCKKRKIYVIADITEWYENYFSLNPIKLIKYIDTSIVMKKLHKKTDGAIAISSRIKQYYSKHIEKIVLLPPLVDIYEKKWNENNIKIPNTIEFVYAGLPNREKERLDLIVSSFCSIKQRSNFHLNIIGITRDCFLAIYPSFKENNIDEGRVTFYERMSHDDCLRRMKECDYSIFFRNNSRKNDFGFPTKFVESATLGMGIITNDFSDIKNYSNSNVTIIDTLDENSIKKAIVMCLEKGKIKKEISDLFYYKNYFGVMYEFFKSFDIK